MPLPRPAIPLCSLALFAAACGGGGDDDAEPRQRGPEVAISTATPGFDVGTTPPPRSPPEPAPTEVAPTAAASPTTESAPRGDAPAATTTVPPENPTPAPPVASGGQRIRVHPQNPRYYSWNGDIVFPIGNTESGADSCSTQNGWMAISSGFDWRPDLENLLAHGGNFTRVIPYFPTHPIMPWVEVEGGRYDLSQINEQWVQRMRDYFAWTEAHGIVVLLEVWENWSFVNMERPYSKGWIENPWNPDRNVNYGPDQISTQTDRPDAAIYRALTDEKPEVMALLQLYVARLLDVTLPHGNILYNISNESNAPLAWSEYWADFIHRYAEDRGYSVLVGEMPHAYEPNTGLGAIAASPSFDYVDAASHVSEDAFGQDNEIAEIAGTDTVLTDLWAASGKPISIGKVYYRTPATLWSKFINGVAGVQYHRNCDRGGSNETNPQRYFDFVQHLRTFVDEIDLTLATSIDDGLVRGVTPGVRADVLAAPGSWYAVFIYREDQERGKRATFNIELPEGEYTAGWFDPVSGNWTPTEGVQSDAGPNQFRFTTPQLDLRSVALLIKMDR